MALLAKNETGKIDKALRDVIERGCTRGLYESQLGLNLAWDVAKIDRRRIDKLLSKPWTSDGKTFIDRIWDNGSNLLNGIETVLTQALIRGDPLPKTTAALSKRFQASRRNAGRLIHTETACFSVQSNLEAYQEIGADAVEIAAALDTHTRGSRQPVDGKVIPLKDAQAGVTVPPYHPRCRCAAAPAIEEDILGERVARGKDGKVYNVLAETTYEEWKKTFVEGGSKDGMIDHRARGIMNERKMAMGLRRPASYILTDDEIESILEDAKDLEIDTTLLRFNSGKQTGFSDALGAINIRGDILPDLNAKSPRDRMSQRAVLAHEYYGHFLNHPSKYPIGDWRDEFNASYQAAINAPNLSDEDRRYLMLDAYDRAKEAGEIVDYTEKAREIIYGYKV